MAMRTVNVDLIDCAVDVIAPVGSKLQVVTIGGRMVCIGQEEGTSANGTNHVATTLLGVPFYGKAGSRPEFDRNRVVDALRASPQGMYMIDLADRMGLPRDDPHIRGLFRSFVIKTVKEGILERNPEDASARYPRYRVASQC